MKKAWTLVLRREASLIVGFYVVDSVLARRAAKRSSTSASQHLEAHKALKESETCVPSNLHNNKHASSNEKHCGPA